MVKPKVETNLLKLLVSYFQANETMRGLQYRKAMCRPRKQKEERAVYTKAIMRVHSELNALAEDIKMYIPVKKKRGES